MGPLEDEGNRNENNSRKNNMNADLCDVETQKIDSQFSPDGVLEGDGAENFRYVTNTMPLDDAYLLEDAFETQVLNLAGETQVVDLAEETQVVDLAGDTQVLDDLDDMKNMPAGFLNEFNAEVAAASECDGTNKYEALCETQKLSQDDSVKIDCSDSVGVQSTMDNCQPKQVDSASGEPSDAYSNEGPHSGSVCRGFTSIRAASIRASGLAAHARGADGNFCTTTSDKSSPKQQTCERDGLSLVGCLTKSGRKNDQGYLQKEYNGNNGEVRNSSQCQVGSTAVRKLFREDECSEVGPSEADIKHKDDNPNMPELPASENCLAGLSYANSQEPGELSQAYALEVVDRFLDLNVMEYDEGFGTRVRNAEKPKFVSGAKGSRDLAKSSVLRSLDGECGVYDWDDMREDDGGGEFFQKKKELFFEKEGPKQGCLTEPSRHRSPDLGNIKAVGSNGDEKEQFTKNKLGNSVYSDSGVMLHILRARRKSLYCGEEVFQKNLIKDLDEQLSMDSLSKLAENDTNKDVPDMQDVGPDTQTAAEAMENLCFEVHLADNNSNGPNKGAHSMGKTTRKNQLSNRTARSGHCLNPKAPYPTSVGVVTRQAKKLKQTSVSASNESPVSPKSSKRNRKRCDMGLEKAEQRRQADLNVLAYRETESTGQRSKKKHHLGEQLDFSVHAGQETRKCIELNCSKVAANSFDVREETSDLISVRVLRKRRTPAKNKKAEMVTIEQLRKFVSRGFKQSQRTCVDTSGASNIGALDNLQGNRSQQEMLFVGQEADTQHRGRLKRLRGVESISSNPGRNHSNHSSRCDGQALSSLDTESGKILLHQTVNNGSSRNDAAQCDSDHVNVKASLNDTDGASKSKQHDQKGDTETSAEGGETNGGLEASPRERCGTSILACVTPTTPTTPVNNVSPICMGDEYHRQSRRKNLPRLSLIREINNLVTASPGPYDAIKNSGPYGGAKNLRKRKDITNIRVLFSQHLDVDVIKQQKKILARLGGAIASSMSDATHFVADEFVRTRNMLEAIAFGKPVVTHLWLESCGQASCLIDEKTYILRDARKEREFGFCLPVSLSKACQHPLLQGQKVLVTPNTKPGKDILANLIKAVHGLAVERLGRSVLKDEKLPDDLLILSCEEDYDLCVPFLEKGGAVYSSELLLDGIVKQKLEFERHHLFADHVKRTRSTIWVKKKNQYLPVKKCK